MNTPKIRFRGFTDDWEQRKFDELVNEIREKTKSENEDTLLSCAIDGMYLNSELFSHFRGSSNIGYLKVKKNDLILSVQNLHLGNCNVNLRFEHGIISPAYKVYELVDCNPLFIQAWVKQDSTKDFFLKASTEGASVCRKNIVWEELYEQTVSVPEIKEQEKIGYYFRSLDHLITLHQRKCDETKQLKKFMLQKMFPKNGEKNPEIRFEGFTDDWEQRKLGALMEDGIILEQSDGNHGELYPRSEEFVNEGIPYIAASSISSDGERIDFNLTKYLSMERAIQFRKGVAKNGDVLLAHNATVGPSVMLSMDYEFAILSTSLTLYRLDKEKMSPMFFLQAIRSGYFQKQLEVFMKQTTRSQVPILTQRNLQIFYPINKVEQERIGEFLSNLDHLITLHQRKCEKLKELKKFMLQNMFV